MTTVARTTGYRDRRGGGMFLATVGAGAALVLLWSLAIHAARLGGWTLRQAGAAFLILIVLVAVAAYRRFGALEVALPSRSGGAISTDRWLALVCGVGLLVALLQVAAPAMGRDVLNYSAGPALSVHDPERPLTLV